MASSPTLMLNDLLRAGSVRRWHIVSTFRQQTLAEHMYNVAMIAHALAKELGYDDSICASIMRAALYHDIEEVITGDIAAPVKRKFAVDYSVANQVKIAKAWKRIIKAADWLESYWFLDQFGCGSHARAVLDDVDNNYTKWFEQQDTRFQGACVKIMDEINNTKHVII